jgi:ADP-heptose:LPS heptosyltransferase
MAERIMIARTDSIGDVMLTLPMAYYLKQLYPNAAIYFLGKSYTQAIIERCQWVDEFVNADRAANPAEQVLLIQALKLDIIIFALPDSRWMRAAFLARVPKRIATGHRISSWRWASHRPMFGRKNSNLHESQLNLKLINGLGMKRIPAMDEICSVQLFPNTTRNKKRRLIIHPFSQGSALNWTLQQYDELVGQLVSEGWEIVISGTQQDQLTLSQYGGENLKKATSVCGQFSLSAFIDYIAESTMLLACSTGPLHIAASCGIHAVGLYVNRRPIHPGRWSPIGPHVHVLQEEDVGQSQITMSPASVAIFLKSIMEPPTTMR